MPTTSVVEQFDILEQVTSYVIYCIIIPSINPLFLKRCEETLYAGIIIRATRSTHAARDPVLLQHLFIALAGVLCASVAVEDQAFFDAIVGYGVSQCASRKFRVDLFADRIPNDFPVEQVNDDR